MIACRKAVPKGKIIEASGYVVDTVKNKKLANVTIYLFGAHQTFYGIYYDIGPLDSTVSDLKGNFSLKYTAQGNVIDYALSVSTYTSEYGLQNNYVADINHLNYPFNYHDIVYDAIIKARELNYARLNLKVLSNPYDTLYLSVSSYGEFYLRYNFFGTTIDTSILTRCLPNSVNNFEYEIQSSELSDSGINHRIETDIFNADLSDTVVINKIINSTYDIPTAQ